MRATRTSSALDLATVAFMISCCVQPVTAGTKGAFVNTFGVGVAVDAIVFNGVTNTAKSISMQNPCAAVNRQPNLTCNANYTKGLPPGTPSTVYCQSKGSAPGIFSIQSYVTGGATADNPELESRINILPADCAFYSVETEAVFTATNAGTLIVNAVATPGAAIWLRGFEYLGTGSPNDIEELRTNGALRWDVLVAGPFEYSTSNCNALYIPFTIQGSQSNLYFVADAVAKSNPFGVTCPSNVVFSCDETTKAYPPPTIVGGCGQVTVSYDKPANTLPLGTTTVTVTAADEAGNVANCTFDAVVVDGISPVIAGFPSDITINTGPGRTTCDQVATWTEPTASDNCTVASFTANYAPGDTFPVGTTTVTYTATDGAGNATHGSFKVTVVDTTPPKVPVLATLNGNCGSAVTVPVPTTTDNCPGAVTVTPNVPQVFNTTGTHTVTWTFTDDAGNSSTASQTVIVSGLVFNGFYSPISGTGGSCGTPLRTINLGSKIPVKFDVSCSGSPYVAGTPSLSIEKSNAQCTSPTPVGGGNFDLVGNEWHFNWDTSGLAKATYKLTVTLQDGRKKTVWVKLK